MHCESTTKNRYSSENEIPHSFSKLAIDPGFFWLLGDRLTDGVSGKSANGSHWIASPNTRLSMQIDTILDVVTSFCSLDLSRWSPRAKRIHFLLISNRCSTKHKYPTNQARQRSNCRHRHWVRVNSPRHPLTHRPFCHVQHHLWTHLPSRSLSSRTSNNQAVH